MNIPLKILHFEENTTDAGLIKATLEAGDIACVTTWVQNRRDFRAQLDRGHFDLVLSDHSLPSFDRQSAMDIVREYWPDLPVILVTDTMGEQFAVDSLKSGATDYILKNQPLRLVPALRRAMQEVADRTELQLLKARCIEAQKMEVFGHLAAGIAHDFNNILNVTMGYSDILLTKLPTADSLRKYVQEIRRASERGAGLTLQLLIFSRKQTVKPIVMDLNAVMLDLETMLEQLIHQNIALTLSPGTHTSNILADPGYIGQVLINMAVNARDAMPDGGSLTIATSKVTLDEHSTHLYPASLPGDYILLSVSDTGTGMSEEVKERIFEAFFTTKPLGKGTGLGLATCKNIIDQSGGYMSVTSELGKGTTFQILFPCVE